MLNARGSDGAAGVLQTWFENAHQFNEANIVTARLVDLRCGLLGECIQQSTAS